MANTASHRIIRFGIMCSGTRFQAWQAACLRKLLAIDGVKPALLIVDADAKERRDTHWLARLLKDSSHWLWHAYSASVRAVSKATRRVDMSDDFAGVPAIQCKVRLQGKYSQYFQAEDVAAIRRSNLDFILRFGFNIIRGDILHAARFGVWSFHHDDEEKYRGTPPAFWEIYTDDDVTASILQRLTDRLDGGIILRKGFFKTIKTSFVRNRDTAFFESADWPATVCLDIQRGNAEYIDGVPSSTAAPVLHSPNNVQMLAFALKILRNIAGEIARQKLTAEKWNIGVVDSPITVFLNPSVKQEVHWLPTSRYYRFVADPFGVRKEGALCVLFEDFNYYRSKGRISSLRLGNGATAVAENALEESFHLSYPFLIEHEGAIYCVPEASQANRVVLYRADDFPRRWSYIATLIDNFAAVDPTVVRYGGRWWLFATNQKDGNNHKLSIWHAPDLVGPWTPHALKPAKVDVRSARPAGTPFFHEGILYRPAQDCSATYGARVVINRVLKMTPYEFAEEVASVVEPDDRLYRDGIHTLAAVSDVTLVDGMKRVFIGRNLSMTIHKFRRVSRVPLSRGGEGLPALLSAPRL
jgi:hypothetical protein